MKEDISSNPASVRPDCQLPCPAKAVDCEIESPTDRDRYSFMGEAGDLIRVVLLSRTLRFEPRLEVRDPSGAVIADEYCNGGSRISNETRCSLSIELSGEQALSVTGTYLMMISDQGSNDLGEYEISLQCLFGACPQ